MLALGIIFQLVAGLNSQSTHDEFVKKIIRQATEQLQSKIEVVRVSGVRKLSTLYDKKAIPALRNSLSDKSKYVRRIAVEALGRLKAFQATGQILTIVKREKNLFVKKYAIRALVSVGPFLRKNKKISSK